MDELLTLFKGELSLNDITSFSNKRLMELKDTRVERLIREQKEMEAIEKQRQREASKNKIWVPH